MQRFYKRWQHLTEKESGAGHKVRTALKNNMILLDALVKLC